MIRSIDDSESRAGWHVLEASRDTVREVDREREWVSCMECSDSILSNHFQGIKISLLFSKPQPRRLHARNAPSVSIVDFQISMIPKPPNPPIDFLIQSRPSSLDIQFPSAANGHVIRRLFRDLPVSPADYSHPRPPPSPGFPSSLLFHGFPAPRTRKASDCRPTRWVLYELAIQVGLCMWPRFHPAWPVRLY